MDYLLTGIRFTLITCFALVFVTVFAVLAVLFFAGLFLLFCLTAVYGMATAPPKQRDRRDSRRKGYGSAPS